MTQPRSLSDTPFLEGTYRPRTRVRPMRLEFETPLSFQSELVLQGMQLADWAALVQALDLDVSQSLR